MVILQSGNRVWNHLRELVFKPHNCLVDLTPFFSQTELLKTRLPSHEIWELFIEFWNYYLGKMWGNGFKVFHLSWLFRPPDFRVDIFIINIWGGGQKIVGQTFLCFFNIGLQFWWDFLLCVDKLISPTIEVLTSSLFS